MNVHARETHHKPIIVAALCNQAALGMRAGDPHPSVAAGHGRRRVAKGRNLQIAGRRPLPTTGEDYWKPGRGLD
jgi:hypothetical protein